MASVELRDVSKSYGEGLRRTEGLRDVNLTLGSGEFVAVVGYSGSGKTTLMSIVAGLNALTSGGIVLAGREIDGPGPDRGVVFQSPCLLPWMTALENVLLGVEQVHPTRGRKEQAELAAHHLRLVGLEDALHRRPRELSSGMQSRAGGQGLIRQRAPLSPSPSAGTSAARSAP
jgi:nitrate/nitrite transport system ATP-binding protein